MGSRYVKIDRSSRQLLRGQVSGCNYRLPVIGPYVTSIGGVTRARRDCVKVPGGWASKRYEDGERDRSAGFPD